MDRQRLAMRVAEIQGQLDARLEKTEMLLHNLRDYLMWSGENRNDVFARWCYENGLSINCPWLHGILVATNRNSASWPEGVPRSPSAWTTNDWEKITKTAIEHRIACDIVLKSNGTNATQFLTDYDLQGFLRSKTRFSQRVGNSRLGMSEHRIVMLDARSNPLTGTSFLVPLYRPEAAGLAADVLASVRTNWGFRSATRWLHLTSMIVAPVDYGVLTQSIWDGAPADLGIEIFSSTKTLSADTWLNPSDGGPRAADPQFKPYLTHRQTWPMYGMRFSIFFYTTPLFEAQSPRRLARITAAAGTVVTLLAAALVGVALRARDRQEQMTEQIREARDALSAAQQERNKISRDLHDGTIQSLYAIQLGLSLTGEKLAADPDKAGRDLSRVRGELDTVIAEIRQFISAEARADKPVDFSAVLHALVRRACTGTTAEITLQCDPEASERLTGDQAVHLTHIARESLSNSLRHATPQRVEVVLGSEREALVLKISDDGAGFDPKQPGQSGVGLTSLAARTADMGGTLEIQSVPGKGTCVVVRVPSSPPESAAAKWPDDATGTS